MGPKFEGSNKTTPGFADPDRDWRFEISDPGFRRFKSDTESSISAITEPDFIEPVWEPDLTGFSAGTDRLEPVWDSSVLGASLNDAMEMDENCRVGYKNWMIYYDNFVKIATFEF